MDHGRLGPHTQLFQHLLLHFWVNLGVAGRRVVVGTFESNHISLWKRMYRLPCIASALLFLPADVILLGKGSLECVFPSFLTALTLSCPCNHQWNSLALLLLLGYSSMWARLLDASIVSCCCLLSTSCVISSKKKKKEKRTIYTS